MVALAKRHAAIPSPLLAETMGARDTAWLVKEKQLQALVFEGDALLVLATFQQDGQEDYSPFRNILNDTRSMIQPLPQWKIGFCGRETNKVAHRLAQMSLSTDNPILWFEKLLNVIVDLLFEDSNS